METDFHVALKKVQDLYKTSPARSKDECIHMAARFTIKVDMCIYPSKGSRYQVILYPVCEYTDIDAPVSSELEESEILEIFGIDTSKVQWDIEPIEPDENPFKQEG